MYTPPKVGAGIYRSTSRTINDLGLDFSSVIIFTSTWSLDLFVGDRDGTGIEVRVFLPHMGGMSIREL